MDGRGLLIFLYFYCYSCCFNFLLLLLLILSLLLLVSSNSIWYNTKLQANISKNKQSSFEWPWNCNHHCAWNCTSRSCKVEPADGILKCHGSHNPSLPQRIDSSSMNLHTKPCLLSFHTHSITSKWRNQEWTALCCYSTPLTTMSPFSLFFCHGQANRAFVFADIVHNQ